MKTPDLPPCEKKLLINFYYVNKIEKKVTFQLYSTFIINLYSFLIG